MQFCAEHRYPKDHDCSSTESSVRSSNTTSKGPASTNAGLAALARVRRSASKAIASSQSSKPQQRVVIDLSADSSSESDVPKDDEVQLVSEGHLKSKSKSFLPSAADKRAKAERASQLKGLENRAKKGLLSEKEKVQYATLQAAQAKDSGRKKEGECIIL